MSDFSADTGVLMLGDDPEVTDLISVTRRCKAHFGIRVTDV